jgi:Domain of unknown function (DUF4365)
MAAATSKPSRRYSREQQQEKRSRDQFAERVGELGWIASGVEPDLGEDLLVRIYDGGRSTGLSFYVQLKSTADSDALKLKRTPALSYELEVKDLLHWEGSTTLVVLVIWDVEKRAGWWRPVPEIIKDLVSSNAGWKKKKKVCVSIPLTNSTVHSDLNMLRWKVANHNFPLIPKPNISEFELSFPPSDGGRQGVEALRRAVDTGSPVLLEGELVPTIEWPEWHRRAYGSTYPQPISIHVSPKPSDASLAVRIEVESSEGSSALPYIELRCIKQGRKNLVLTNAHQNLPLIFTLEGTDESAWFRFKQARPGNGVHEAREAAAFVLAAMPKGSTIRVVDLATGRPMVTVTSPCEPTMDAIKRARQWHGLLDKLCFIQQRISSQGALSLKNGISRQDIVASEKLFKILFSGKVEGKLSFSGKLAPKPTSSPRSALQSHETPSLEITGTEPTRLLNIEIQLGKVRMVPVDGKAFLSFLKSHQDRANRSGKPVRFRVQDLSVIEEYVEWMPDDQRWERLSELAAHQDGYCTLSQARWVGYAEEVFLALVPAGKIYTCTSDVFRLAHFPRSDHEEYIVLWLQTDRQGVFSHETALLIHELSDILPNRLHITVPPGFKAEFGPSVEVRHGNVAEDEIRWLGPVPYTAPLRTLLDCIEVGVSPDLIEQAIEEGLARGLFTKGQIPPDVRAKSA